jgi:predicted ester cyclase
VKCLEQRLFARRFDCYYAIGFFIIAAFGPVGGNTMSADDPRALVQRYFTAVDERRFDDLAPLFAPAHVGHLDSLPPMTIDQLMQAMGVIFSAFPDLRHRVEEVLVDGDRAAVRVVVEGTHQGDFMGTPPTQRPVSFGAIYIFHCRDGVIAEHWINGDSLGLLQQIGAIPAPAE